MSKDQQVSFEAAKASLLNEEQTLILKDIETKLNQFEFDLANGEYTIKEHCIELS